MNAVEFNQTSLRLIGQIRRDVTPWRESANNVKVVVQRIEFNRIPNRTPNFKVANTYECIRRKQFMSGTVFRDFLNLLNQEMKVIQKYVLGIAPFDQSDHETGAKIRVSVCKDAKVLKSYCYSYRNEGGL